MLKENVTVIFDRKKQAAKRGSGKVELRIYLVMSEKVCKILLVLALMLGVPQA